MTTLTPEQMHEVLQQDGRAILDYYADSAIVQGHFMYVPTWIAGTQPETVADRGFQVVVIVSLLYETLRIRQIEPYCSIPTTRLMLQAIASSTLSMNNLMTLPLEDSPVVEEAKRAFIPMLLNAVLKPLTPALAAVIHDAWTTQLTNEQNPVTQLVTCAEHIHTMMWGLNEAVGGNTAVRSIVLDAAIKTRKIADSIESGFKDVLYGILNPIAELLGLEQEPPNAASAE